MRCLDRFRSLNVSEARPVIDSFHMTLSPSKAEVARARRFVTTVAHEINQERLSDVVELLTSELVTNAILHGGGEPLRLAVGWSPPVFRVEVFDRSPQLPAQRHYAAEASTGRGLALVAALASDWGATPIGDSAKAVWFEVNTSDSDSPA